MILKDINRQIILTIIFVLVVSAGFMRMTYAVFSIDENSSEDNKVIEFGDVSMTLTSSNTTVIGTVTNGSATSYTPQYPVNDPLSNAYSNVSWSTTNDTKSLSGTANTVSLSPYKFTLSNTGDVDLMVTIFLSPDATVTGTRTNSGSKTLASGVTIVGENITSSTADLNDSSIINYTEQYTNAVSSNQYKYFNLALADDSVNVPNFYNLASDVFLKSNNSEVINDTTVYKLESFQLDSGESKSFSLYMWLSIEELKKYTCTKEQQVCTQVVNQNGNTETICNNVEVDDSSKTTCVSQENINDVIGRYLVTQISAKGIVIPVS